MKKITYQDAGVDVKAGYRTVEKIKTHIKSTSIPGVLSHLGSFGGLFQLDIEKYTQPILVSGTDGVGTKLKLAFRMDMHNTVGIDLVAMCANDVLCHGAKPLFFLDYIATGKLNPEKVTSIVEGVAEGCKEAECALIGGETAEMPNFYKNGEYDLAGFCVGVVDKHKLINGEKIQPGDVLIGLPSSGLHSNGFSLVRKLFFEGEKKSKIPYGGGVDHRLEEELLIPTKIYVKIILDLMEKFYLKGLVHITGGGFIENIPRMLPQGCMAQVDIDSFPHLPIFKRIEELGNLDKTDMYNTFNMGIGMVLAVDKEEAPFIIEYLVQKGEPAYIIGSVSQGEKGIEL